MICIGGLCCLGGSCLAVVIRHDVGDAEYQRFAAREDLSASRVGIYDIREKSGGISYSGTLVGRRYVLTASHPVEGYLFGMKHGPVPIKVNIDGAVYECDYGYVVGDRKEGVPGYRDVALLRLKQDAPARIKPHPIYIGKLRPREIFVGVGYGRSGTGKQNDEPLVAGTVRAFQNCVDYIDLNEIGEMRSDFDDGTAASNSLASKLFGNEQARVQGSDYQVLPLEGTAAAGDSGGGILVTRDGRSMVAAVIAYRYYSCYSGQLGASLMGYFDNSFWLNQIVDALPDGSIEVIK